jgi:predicted AAA+ superfamily ATPase
MDANVFFFRDKHGNEIDLLLPRGNKLIPVEIKSSQTYHKEFNKNINYIKKIYPDRIKKSYLVYGGVQEQITEGNNLINFLNISKQIELI